MPGLIWNAMMSMSGGWFFVVASEAITVGDKTITLPGIGSYVALAIEQRDMSAIFWAIGAMFCVIFAYDQLLFRPLVAWSEKFRFELTDSGESSDSWMLRFLKHTRLLRHLLAPLRGLSKWFLMLRLPVSLPPPPSILPSSKTTDIMWTALVVIATVYGGYELITYLSASLTWADVGTATEYGLFTLVRVLVLIALASIFWVPIGIWVGLRPHVAEKIQPLAQFLAAFPANLFFPVAVMLIVKFNLHPDIWLSPLIILGTQWYILFNVIGGAMAFPGDLREAATNFHLRGSKWWTKVMLPGIFPYYITGAITASGGSWNASIVAETVNWGNTTVTARGAGRLYRAGHRQRRLSAHSARHHRDVGIRIIVQPAFLAQTL